MDHLTIKEIIRMIFEDRDMVPTDDQYEKAIAYYELHNQLPSVEYLMGDTPIENQISNIVMNTTENNPVLTGNIRNQILSFILHIDPNSFQHTSENDNSDDEDNTNTDSPENREDTSPNNNNNNNQAGDNPSNGRLIFIADNIYQQLQLSQSNLESVKKVLSKGQIEKLKLDVIREDMIDNCVICCENYIKTEIIRILPCNHRFHRGCVDKYLKKNSINCPICRQPSGEGILINL